ncbi:MAG: MCE family protein [Proteobacteria bacterium]|nr:MCE family protein [Pseudomonadota bacterium]
MRRTDYFRLGAFILSGTALFVFVVILLGAGRFFSKPVLLETYFNEAVNGLEIGSPVRYRGVKVGRVSDIGFVMGRYTTMDQSDYRYVYVECELENHEFLARSKGTPQVELDQEIFNGLRIRPISQGLTGTLYMGIDYVPPKLNPPLKIAWVPNNLYIPSAPSTMSRIEAAISKASQALGALNKEDMDAILKSVRSVAENLSTFLETADAKAVGEILVKNLEQTERLFAQVNVILKDEGAVKLLPTAQLVLGDVHRFMAATHDDLVAAIADMRTSFSSLKKTTAKLERAMNDPKTDVAGVMRNVRDASERVDVAAARFQELMNRVNGLVAGQEAGVEEIVENARLVVQNLKELTEEAKRYPSGVLFGQPPAQQSPGSSAP